jgi:hypothetical protein
MAKAAAPSPAASSCRMTDMQRTATAKCSGVHPPTAAAVTAAAAWPLPSAAGADAAREVAGGVSLQRWSSSSAAAASPSRAA